MTSYNALVTKNSRDEKAKFKKQSNINTDDAAVIDILYRCVSQSLDAKAARDLIQTPEKIINLLQNNEHEFKCFYAIHVLLLALVGDNCVEILNTMSDRDISILQECMDIAKKHPRPNRTATEGMLNTRTAGFNMGYTVIPSVVNNCMTKSAHIALTIDDLWDEAVLEIYKWLDAIKHLEKTKDQQPAPVQSEIPEQEMWTIDELVEKLGCKNKNAFKTRKCWLIERNTDRAEEIKSWFVFRGPLPALFKAEFFDEFQKLWKQQSKKQEMPPIPKPKIESPKKAVEPKIAVVEEKQHIKTPKTLPDVKAFELYISALQELWTNANNELQKAEKTYKNTMQEVSVAHQSKRHELLERALQANDSVTEFQTTVNEFKTRLDAANKLLQDRNQAMNTLNSIDAEIAKLLKEFKQNKQ